MAAVGDTSFVLLVNTLVIGPVSVLWPSTARWTPWRRPLGIWFALAALVHAALVWDGWARWDLPRLFGYEELPAAGTDGPILVEPGFGLANLIGLLALLLALVLLATSSERALRHLGPTAWKQIQLGAHTTFYLVALHSAYFLFLHYDLNLTHLVFQKSVPPPNWFQVPFVVLVLVVPVLQGAVLLRRVGKWQAERAASDEPRR